MPELSPPVPTVSMAPGGESMLTALERITRAAPVISSTVSPRTRSAIRKPPIWDGVALPDMMMSKARPASASPSRPPPATLARIAFISARSPWCAGGWVTRLAPGAGG